MKRKCDSSSIIKRTSSFALNIQLWSYCDNCTDCNGKSISSSANISVMMTGNVDFMCNYYAHITFFSIMRLKNENISYALCILNWTTDFSVPSKTCPHGQFPKIMYRKLILVPWKCFQMKRFLYKPGLTVHVMGHLLLQKHCKNMI